MTGLCARVCTLFLATNKDNRDQNSCLLFQQILSNYPTWWLLHIDTGKSWRIRGKGKGSLDALLIYFFSHFRQRPTCPPVAQSLTVELRSLGSNSPSNVFKTSYSAIRRRYGQINQFEFKREILPKQKQNKLFEKKHEFFFWLKTVYHWGQKALCGKFRMLGLLTYLLKNIQSITLRSSSKGFFDTQYQGLKCRRGKLSSHSNSL